MTTMSSNTLAMDKIEELLTRGVANIIPSKDKLKDLLQSGKKLNIYLGIDPTATRIHLGHAVPLRKLQTFAELGHNVTFLIGDFTALIGDTSDKDTERPVLTSDEIEKNFQTYKKQAEKILDFSKVKVVHNSEWLSKLSYKDVISLMQRFSLNDFISRELIKKRLNEGKRIGLHEVQYPIMQGYDSYFLDTNIQIGGTDQTFNMQAGRTLQKDLRNKESFILAMEFLEGTDGRKMSKSWGNAIWLEDSPNDMYAKIMAIKDDLILQYYTLGTNMPFSDIEKVKNRLAEENNPMEIKKELAYYLVSELHFEKDAKNAQEHFEKTVQQKELPTDIPEFTWSPGQLLADLMVEAELATSKSEAKRLIDQGGVTIDEEVIIDPNAPFSGTDGSIVRVGKRKFVKIKTNK